MYSTLLVFIAALPAIAAWAIGDSVPIMERSSYKGEVTSWRETGPMVSPRFGKDKSTGLHAPDKDEAAEGDYKVQFKLGHDLGWQTTWIPFQTAACRGKPGNSNCERLVGVHFTFHYEKNIFGKITGFRFNSIYSKKAPETIQLNYYWIEQADHDLNKALGFIYCISAVFGFAAVWFLTLSSSTVQRGEMLVCDKTN
eukprot:TRINITY_DN76681_c0_g1_i1.p1 TRINITY_DN76681_c0_g1~~TRINITY_DN76681_c0_g1_i1.p1  ORF type:complete len:197 (+),score=7.50 TRINITY_DN76681_c0_g1_i1:77-667(+)